MSISSMTGFARAAGEVAGHDWTWEIRSVNSKGLDIRCRLPSGLEVIESDVRNLVSARLARGSVALNLTCRRAAGTMDVTVNQDLLAQIGKIADDVANKMRIEPPRLDGLLSVKGVLTVSEPLDDETGLQERNKAILTSLGMALDDLLAARSAEGVRTDRVLRDHIGQLETLIESARRCAAAQPEALKSKLQSQVDALLDITSSLPEERIAQEVAILITRTDVREELDRLSAHVAAAYDLLDAEGPVGRKLEFLAQEFNREANTLCSKSADMELTPIGLELKAVIDRMREQVANIE